MSDFTFGKRDDAVVRLHDPTGLEHLYDVRPTTRNAALVLDELRKMEQTEGLDFDVLLDPHIRFADVKLAPRIGARPAGEVLRESWEANEAGVEDFLALTEHLAKLEKDAPGAVDDPPTSEPTSGSTTSVSDTSPASTGARQT